MKSNYRCLLSSFLLTIGASTLGTCAFAADANSTGWDSKAAARYMDSRAEWWVGWPRAARDHETFCVSCHTAVPYVLSRPALRKSLGETTGTATEQKIVDDVAKRVRLWSEVEPYYGAGHPEDTNGPGSRSTEVVLNALVLVSHDATTGDLSADSKTALNSMWALQVQAGREQGWLDLAELPLRAVGVRRLRFLWRCDGRAYNRARSARLPIVRRPSRRTSLC